MGSTGGASVSYGNSHWRYDELVGLDWRWQSVDAAMTKSPLGGEMTGKNPTDRGKQGTKRSVITDTVGIPTGLVMSGVNTFTAPV